MKSLDDSNSSVILNDNGVAVRFHNTRLQYQVDNVVEPPDDGSVHVAGHYPDGVPYYTGFPEIELEYNGEILHGIVEKADLRSVSVQLKGYPKVHNPGNCIPVFALPFVQLLNRERTDLSEKGRSFAISQMKDIYHVFHHPVTGEYMDIISPLSAFWTKTKDELIQRYQSEFDGLISQKKDLKTKFKSDELTESDYQRGLKNIRAGQYQLKQKQEIETVQACTLFLMETYHIPKESVGRYMWFIDKA